MKLTTSPSSVAAMALAASSLAAAQNSTACSTGVHMLVARGSDEAAGSGRMGIIADGILEAIPGSNIEPVAYPATFTEYADSVNDGVEAMGFALTRYAERCPDSKVVLMGYSQGGQVTMNTLCGGPAEGSGSILPFDDNPPISSAIVNGSVIAVVVFGDPTFIRDAPWKEGNSTSSDGLFARQDISACLPYAPKIRSWCDEGDRYCALGEVASVHGGYFTKYFNEAVDFVVQQREGADESGSPTSSAVPSGTATASPSGTESAAPSGTEDAASTGTDAVSSPTETAGAGMTVMSWGALALVGLVGLMNM